MKKQFTGFSKVFSFTFIQHVKSKGYKNTTIVIALLCLLLPALIMIGVEKLGGSEPQPSEFGEVTEQPSFAGIEDIKRVVAVDLSEDKQLDISMLSAVISEMTGAEIQVVDMGDDFETARRSTVASEDALIMVTEQEGSSYTTSVVIPDGSSLSEESTESFAEVFDQYTQLMTSQGQPEEEYEDDDPMVIGEIVTIFAGYLNIMILYFFVLAYGQGVANSVVMEKSSKLVESFLVSVKPSAMVLGKLLAITATGIMQLFSWIISLVISFAAGTAIVKSINPETDMFIIKIFDILGTLVNGIFSPANCIMAIFMVISGMLLYCALAAIGGALASKTEDLSSANVAFTLILVISFFAVLFGGGLASEGEAHEILDWIPFTSVMITPGRVLMGTLPLWKTLASLVVTLVVTLIAVAGAGKIYKSLILYKGDIPTPKDIIKMMKRA